MKVHHCGLNTPDKEAAGDAGGIGASFGVRVKDPFADRHTDHFHAWLADQEAARVRANERRAREAEEARR